MGNRDLRSVTEHRTLFAKVAVTATQAIQGTDVTGFDGAKFVVDIGAWTVDGITVTFQDSDDNSTWADIADTNLDGQANDIALKHGHANAVIEVGYSGNKKYIGAKLTDSGSGSCVVGVYVNLGFSSKIPVHT
jgi:hypothetical protein